MSVSKIFVFLHPVFFIHHILIIIMKYGFDNEKYLRIQSEHIKERIGKFGNKLYLEFGG